MLALAPALLLGGCVSEGGEGVSVTPTKARKGESQAEALYRHGVNCMDVIERRSARSRNFEQLVALDPPRRELVGDAIFRLVDLYQRNEDPERVKELLRRFWDVGMRKGHSATLPYSTRYMSEHMTALVHVDVEQLEPSYLFTSLPDDDKHYMFTCDEQLREQLREKREARREAAAPPIRRRRRPAARSVAKSVGSSGARRARRCPTRSTTRAFVTSRAPLATPTCVSGRSSPTPKTTSTRACRCPCCRSPSSTPSSPRRSRREPWSPRTRRCGTLAGVEYEGEAIQITKLDRNELMLAPARLMPGVIEAEDSRTVRLRPDLQALAEQVPNDVVFFTVVTQDALVHGIETIAKPPGRSDADTRGPVDQRRRL